MAAVLGLVCGAAIVCTAIWQWSVLSRHDTIQQLQELPVNARVHLIGVVTYVDLPEKRLWLQDDTGAVAIPLSPAEAGIHVGQTVAVDATKTAPFDRRKGPVSVDLRSIDVHPTAARVRLPQPFPVTLANFPTPEKNGIRVQTTAIVEDAGVDAEGRAHLAIADSGPEVELIVAQPDRDYSLLIDSRIRVVGLPEQIRAPHGALLANRLWVADGHGLHIEQSASKAAPVYSVRSLYAARKLLSGHRVRMHGRITAVAPGSVLLQDQWGAIACRLSAPQSVPVGAIADVEGFPSKDGLRIDLAYSRIVSISPNLTDPALDHAPSVPPLVTVAAIRSLSAASAAQAFPVRVTGVITYIDPQWRQMFLQDHTGAIFAKFSGTHPELAAGQRVTLRGITSAGDFAPVIVAPKFKIVGSAPLPTPEPVTFDDASAGLLDSRYVSIEGIVHPMKSGEESNHPALTFELLTSVGQVHVYTSPVFSDPAHSRSLEDAKVRIRGVFGTVYNSRRQLVGYQLLVQSRSNVDVLEPPVADPFAMESTPIGFLLRYSPHARFGHRVRIEGVVTLVQPDFLYLQDQGDGIEVRGETRGIRVGDQIDAVGYPTLVGRYSPIMTDALFRPTGRTGTIAPRVATAESILQGHEDSMLVTVDGKLLMALDGPARRSLVLQSGVRTFTAQLDTSDLGPALTDLREGSVLRLTGVSSAQVDPGKLYRILEEDPASFQLLLRSPADVAVIGSAPFWNLRSTLALLALLSLLTVAILMWVGILRRRVRLQTAALRKASETAQAIRDLSIAMQSVSAEQKLDTQVSVRGSEEVAHLVVGFNQMLAELRLRDAAKREAEARLQHMALMDELTGLPNRRLLSDRLSQSLAKARREQRMVALLYMDLDGFKLVNDSLGHNVGDLLLGQVAQRLKSRFRQSDTLARIGGDEFTLILDSIQNKEDAELAAQGILEILNAPFDIGGHSIRIAASIGISLFPDHGLEAGQLLQQADCAMYAAKRNGKNRVVQFGDNLGNAARERLTLEGELRRAIAEGEITVHYQPEFDLVTNVIVRFEALARWTHPKLGVIPPLNFIPVAEECGLIIPLGAYVMEQACRDAVAWQKHSSRPVQVAVNVSSVQFGRDSFIQEVEEVLHRTGLPPTLLQIELTESATLAGIERAAESMRRLKDMGISIAMDDFGTGYSSLSYLPRLSFDALKIDRSFVNELMVRSETHAFVQSILTLAHNLHMKVIVEGIETREQLELIRSLGANEAQGYLLGRPSADPLEHLRRETKTSAPANAEAFPELEEVPQP